MLGLQRKSTSDLYFPCFEISKGLFLFPPCTHFAKLIMHLEDTFYSENTAYEHALCSVSQYLIFLIKHVIKM